MIFIVLFLLVLGLVCITLIWMNTKPIKSKFTLPLKLGKELSNNKFEILDKYNSVVAEARYSFAETIIEEINKAYYISWAGK